MKSDLEKHRDLHRDIHAVVTQALMGNTVIAKELMLELPHAAIGCAMTMVVELLQVEAHILNRDPVENWQSKIRRWEESLA